MSLRAGLSVSGCLKLIVVYLTLTDPLRIHPWSQDRRNQTKSNREHGRRQKRNRQSRQNETGKNQPAKDIVARNGHRRDNHIEKINKQETENTKSKKKEREEEQPHSLIRVGQEKHIPQERQS